MQTRKTTWIQRFKIVKNRRQSGAVNPTPMAHLGGEHDKDDHDKDKSENLDDNPEREIVPDEDRDVDNYEISINHVSTGTHWNRKEIIIDSIFAYSIATKIVADDDEIEPQNIDECRKRHDWSKWKEAIQVELKSLEKREVFGQILPIPMDTRTVGYK